jgi:hypothetical protein
MKAFYSLCTVMTLVPALHAQYLVLPDNHHLSESPVQLSSVGSTGWWGTSSGRFQIVYEASHFLGNTGITGPVTIRRLRFRGEDGEPNLGGQVYAGVVVELGATTLTNATLGSTFAVNRAAPTTTMGPAGTAAVTVLPSTGSTPNNWCIDIDLLAIGASFTIDPTSAQPNLFIDIQMPTPPSNAPPLALIPIQDTSGGPAVVRGAGVSATPSTALTGVVSQAPPVVGLELSAGGHASIQPARNEFYGAACGGSPSTFYQAFLNGQAFDLGAGLTLTPDNNSVPNYYIVSGGAPAVDTTKVNTVPNSTADDALVSHALGFTFKYPGGSTTTAIKPCTNGYVWLDPAMTAADPTPSIDELLGTTLPLTARLMPFWMDFAPGNNSVTHPNAGLHVLTDTSAGLGNAVCYVTWLNTGIFNSVSGPGISGQVVYTMQCVLYEATGVVQFRYGAMPPFQSDASGAPIAALVGFTRGRLGTFGSADPQSRDLSVEVPFTTKIEGGHNMGLTAVATPNAGGPQYGGRLFGGQTIKWNVEHIPAGSVLGAQLLDLSAQRPGLSQPTITAPGCILSTSTSALIWEWVVAPGNSFAGTVPCVLPFGFEGYDVYAQFVVLAACSAAPTSSRSRATRSSTRSASIEADRDAVRGGGPADSKPPARPHARACATRPRGRATQCPGATKPIATASPSQPAERAIVSRTARLPFVPSLPTPPVATCRGRTGRRTRLSDPVPAAAAAAPRTSWLPSSRHCAPAAWQTSLAAVAACRSRGVAFPGFAAFGLP